MIIELKNISKTYNKCIEAVKNVSFGVEEGQIVSLLGPSGCGKTTLLRLLAGLERPEKGEIILRGEPVVRKNHFISPEKRGIGMVFQDYALFPHLTVQDNVAFGFKGKEKRKKKSKIQETIELVGLAGMEKKYPAELSGGQQQRVALARSLVLDPLLVLLDEPFSNLDVNLRDKMRHDVTRIIRQSKATAIFVTHDQVEALTISDKIIVMNKGEVEQIGSPRDIYQLPETDFVASFVGQSNILEGIIGEDSQSVITDIGKIPCHHTHAKKPGEKVSISIRPDSFEYDTDGPLEGIVEEYSYKGVNIDVTISVNKKYVSSDREKESNQKKRLLVHVHPELEVKKGEKLNFKVLSDFVAVIQ
ncbi:ABC transporter ATP-binding protein [Natronospora cellulosivora (SeqCode)]